MDNPSKSMEPIADLDPKAVTSPDAEKIKGGNFQDFVPAPRSPLTPITPRVAVGPEY